MHGVAMQGLVLAVDLHLTYLVTPIDEDLGVPTTA